jgi:hypothetical protein
LVVRLIHDQLQFHRLQTNIDNGAAVGEASATRSRRVQSAETGQKQPLDIGIITQKNMNLDLVKAVALAFKAESAEPPSTSLRGGDALDDNEAPPAFDAQVDKGTDEYIERYIWGLSYLDPRSWRHYLPILVEYTLRHAHDGSHIGDALLASLRPPDKDPPRLASVSAEQESVIVELLDYLAFSEASAHQAFACQLLEEWWAPNALYRPRAAW